MFNKRSEGFTLIEAVVTIAIFVVGVAGLIQMSTLAKATSEQSRDTIQASNYLQEGLEAMRSIRAAAWANISTDGSYHLTSQPLLNPPWTLTLGGSETLGKYSRTVTISPVRRADTNGSGTLNAGDKIVTSGGDFDDPDTKKITITITWKQGSRTITRAIFGYLTNW